jgi:hypothetical protein
MFFQRLLVLPKSKVLSVFGKISLFISEANSTLSVSASPIVILPPSVKLPVTLKFPVILVSA